MQPTKNNVLYKSLDIQEQEWNNFLSQRTSPEALVAIKQVMVNCNWLH